MRVGTGKVVRRTALTVLAALALIASSYTETGALVDPDPPTNFTCYTGFALTIGGWAQSPKGKAYLDDSDPDWRDLLDELCLVDNQGNAWSPNMTGTFEEAYLDFRSWMLAPVLGNMAFNLSRQMAAVVLSIEVGGYAFIDEPWVDWDGNKELLWDVIDEANDLICQYIANPPAPGPRGRGGANPLAAQMEEFLTFFDGINNNVISVCKEDTGTPTNDTIIRVTKFYDLNLNGVWDSGEVTIPGWTIWLYDATGTTQLQSGTTDANGEVEFVVDQDNTEYLVVEAVPEPYVNITPASISVFADQPVVEVDFGNVAIQCHQGFGKTLGGWHNPSQGTVSALTAAHPGWAVTLNSFNLVDGAGNGVTFDTSDSNAARTQLSSFLVGPQGPSANNMANMLSAQMAAVILDVVAGELNVHPGIMVFWDGAYINIWDLFDIADQSLAAHPITTNPHPERATQEALKDFFDDLNNNREPYYAVLPGSVPFGPLPCVHAQATASVGSTGTAPSRQGARTRPSRR
jgi:hypothetical protein